MALLRDGFIPRHRDAKIIAIRKLGAASPLGGDWRSKLPPGWGSFREDPYELDPGTILQLGNRRAGIRWTGDSFVPAVA